MFAWVRAKIYEEDRSFQRFHMARHNERQALQMKDLTQPGAR
jgi:hypothetical protein